MVLTEFEDQFDGTLGDWDTEPNNNNNNSHYATTRA